MFSPPGEDSISILDKGTAIFRSDWVERALRRSKNCFDGVVKFVRIIIVSI